MSYKLNHNIVFDDLYNNDGLNKLDTAFIQKLYYQNNELYITLQQARSSSTGFDASTLMITLAPYVNQFIAELFQINEDVTSQIQAQQALNRIFDFKRNIIQKRILPKYKNFTGLKPPLTFVHVDDLQFIDHYENATDNNDVRTLVEYNHYIAWRCLDNEGQSCQPRSSLFEIPKPVDYDQLFDYEQSGDIIKTRSPRLRNGFALTDDGPVTDHSADHVHYCLKCHNTNKDSCSTGLNDVHGMARVNPLGSKLQGCPLEQKISEMNTVMQQGYMIAALGIIAVDNPMVAATGYRICNDCEQACIFQKQTPVNVPSIETKILQNVLNLPWGFEIYSLLTRWNPFNFHQPLPLSFTPFHVLVVGAGPAGFTLAHYLLRQGHGCTVIDGLKIEPLPLSLVGISANDQSKTFEPIINISTLMQPLDERVIDGFGGVAEYGITARWNKNYLKIIRIILARQVQFHLYGQVRFGGTLTLSTARKLGFDHVALCTGAGKPSFPQIPNLYAQGVRAASDFLMALQLTGADRPTSSTPLQIRLPIYVLGGGLTAIDTATESLAYYALQVLKFATAYDQACTLHGHAYVEDYINTKWTADECTIAQEFLHHGRLLQTEQAQALQEQRQPRFAEYIQQWGGVTVLYRQRMQQSPAYRLNAHEIDQALKQGVWFREQSNLQSVKIDHNDVLTHITIANDEQPLPCRTLLIAVGTQPNTYCGREHPQDIVMHDDLFVPEDDNPQSLSPFIKNSVADHYVSAFGDVDPRYAGSVVKAMASAKNGYPYIDHVLRNKAPDGNTKLCNQNLTSLLSSHMVAHEDLTPHLVKVIIRSPLAAQAYQPGQFFRLHYFNFQGLHQQPSRGLAVTPIDVQRDHGLITFVLSTRGPGQNFFKFCKIGDVVSLMGPTGCPSPIPIQQTVIVRAQGFHTLLMIPIINAMLAAGCKIYLQANGDDQFTALIPTHHQLHKIQTHDDVIEILPVVDHVLVMGSGPFMQEQQVFFQQQRNLLKPDCQIQTSINSPMHCMLKEICAQCIQLHRDEYGAESIIYSCAQQDQPLMSLDFTMLRNRLNQNSVIEKMAQFIK